MRKQRLKFNGHLESIELRRLNKQSFELYKNESDTKTQVYYNEYCNKPLLKYLVVAGKTKSDITFRHNIFLWKLHQRENTKTIEIVWSDKKRS